MQPINSGKPAPKVHGSPRVDPKHTERWKQQKQPNPVMSSKAETTVESNFKPLGEVPSKQVNRIFSERNKRRAQKVTFAPSRASYRWERLWLTPMFRRVVRTGLPLVVFFAVAGFFLSDADIRQGFTDRLAQMRENIETRPEFTIELMKVSGASDQTASLIRQSANVGFPISSFELNLEELQKTVEELPPIKGANLFLRNGGVLEVTVEERTPVVLFRDGAILKLIDQDAVTTGVLAKRTDRSDLTVITGKGAQNHIREALELVEAAGPLRERVRGLLRVGERRWDIILDRGQTVMLPQENPVEAMQRVVALHSAQAILDRDITVMDMRDGTRPSLRLTEPAFKGMRRIKSAYSGE